MNTLDGRFYIGVHKTTNPNDRYLGSGLHLTAAVKKYGREVFKKEVLFTFKTSEEAYAKEKELVTKELIESGQVYNIATGGVPSIDWLEGERKRTAKRGEKHHQWKKARTAEQKKASSDASKRLWSEERDKMNIAREKAANTRRGKPSALRGSTQTEEANAKRAETHRNLPKKKCPICGRETSPSNFLRHVSTHSE